MEQAFQIDEMKEERNQNSPEARNKSIVPIIVMVIGTVIIAVTVVIWKKK